MCLVIVGLLAGSGPAARADDGLTGTWQGHHVCAQGETGLTLTIRPGKAGGQLRGLFHFYAAPGNPPVPEGCFSMSGTYDGAVRQVSLLAVRWLLQPADYVTVDLDGQLGPTSDRLSGRVVGPLCTGFNLQRISRSVAAPAACSGKTAVLSER